MAVRPLFEAAMAPTNSPSTLVLFFFSVRTLLTVRLTSRSAQPKPVLLVAAIRNTRVILLFLFVLRFVGIPRTSHASAQPQDATTQPPFPIASAFCIKGTP